MQRIVLALVIAGVAATARADERSVIIPLDNTKPFTVEKSDYVRIPASTISGGSIKIAITGPAKLVTESTVNEKAGDSLVIGSLRKEFDLKPSGKGRVKVVITTTLPQPGAKPTVTEYEFEVK